MSERTPRYCSYLVRIWCGGAGEPARWRVELEDPRTGERRAFADLAAAFAFLEAQLCPPNGQMADT